MATRLIVHMGGLVGKETEKFDWSEYPVMYADTSLAFDKPEVFSMKDRTFIRKCLMQIKGIRGARRVPLGGSIFLDETI